MALQVTEEDGWAVVYEEIGVEAFHQRPDLGQSPQLAGVCAQVVQSDLEGDGFVIDQIVFISAISSVVSPVISDISFASNPLFNIRRAV